MNDNLDNDEDKLKIKCGDQFYKMVLIIKSLLNKNVSSRGFYKKLILSQKYIFIKNKLYLYKNYYL